MYVGSLCNKEMVDDVAQDKATFAIYLKVLHFSNNFVQIFI